METNKGEIICLGTFPDDDCFGCKEFAVEREWLKDVVFHTFKCDLESFLTTYTWDATWQIYLKAVADGEICAEREVF